MNNSFENRDKDSEINTSMNVLSSYFAETPLPPASHNVDEETNPTEKES